MKIIKTKIAKFICFLFAPLELLFTPVRYTGDMWKVAQSRVALSVVPFVFGYSKGYRDLLRKQSALETGFMTSSLFKRANNLFGMNHPSKRDTLSSGSSNGFATFQSPVDSVIDRILWDMYNGIEPDHLMYPESVFSKNYATDPKYLDNWKAVKVSKSNMQQSSIWITFALLFVSVGWIVWKIGPFIIRLLPFLKRRKKRR